MTYHQLKAEAEARLREAPDVENAGFEAETLLLHTASLDRAAFLAKRADDAPTDVQTRLFEAVERRTAGEPLQYVLGEWEFCGLRMFCGPGCLIPRPETELCVEKAIEKLPRGGRFLDLCTGSGCIATAILKSRPDAVGTAVDLSADALIFARKNAAFHKVESRLTLVCAPLEDFLPDFSPDVIVSNPPYVKTADVDAFPAPMRREPRLAFDGGPDGLVFYRRIADRYAPLLAPGGVFVLETGYDTADGVGSILRSRGLATALFPDLAGIPRVCAGKKTNQ